MTIPQLEVGPPQDNPWPYEKNASISISVKGFCPTCKFEKTSDIAFNYVLLFDINGKAHPDNGGTKKVAGSNSVRLSIESLLLDHQSTGCEAELNFPTDTLLPYLLE